MSRVRTTFNKASAKYDDSAFLQNEISNRLAEKLNVISIDPKTIIDLGSGTGFLSEKAVKAFPNATLICIDFAQQSLLSNVHDLKVCANAYQLPFTDNSIDFIVSNLMMQWCPDLKILLDECFRVLKPEGLFLFSTFGPDTLKEFLAQDTTASSN